MRRLLLLVLVLSACSAERAQTDCPDGGTRGPLGSCVFPNACDTCEVNADCAPGSLCLELNGCLSCSTRQHGASDAGTPACSMSSCHSGNECCEGFSCTSEADPPRCGACQRPLAPCESDAACGEGEVCVLVPPPPCACDPAPQKECRPRCQTAGCPDGERCAASGACEPLPCTEGFQCPAFTRCQANPMADAHGCVRRACLADSECAEEGGLCVKNVCVKSPGQCLPPMP